MLKIGMIGIIWGATQNIGLFPVLNMLIISKNYFWHSQGTKNDRFSILGRNVKDRNDRNNPACSTKHRPIFPYLIC